MLACVPPEWSTTAADFLQEVNSVTSTRQWLTLAFRISFSTFCEEKLVMGQKQRLFPHERRNLSRIHRIENSRLWHRYEFLLLQIWILMAMAMAMAIYGHILKRCCNIHFWLWPLAADLERFEIAWHVLGAQSIVREGFDHRTCERAFYGAGVYFACAACKSHQYTCHHKKCCGCKHSRTLIIARVALGDAYIATETRKNERRPPLRSDFSGTFDSILAKPGAIKGHHNSKQIHQEFAIFDREQAYPAYIVQYSVWKLFRSWYDSMCKGLAQILVMLNSKFTQSIGGTEGFHPRPDVGTWSCEEGHFFKLAVRVKKIKKSSPNSWLEMESVLETLQHHWSFWAAWDVLLVETPQVSGRSETAMEKLGPCFPGSPISMGFVDYPNSNWKITQQKSTKVKFRHFLMAIYFGIGKIEFKDVLTSALRSFALVQSSSKPDGKVRTDSMFYQWSHLGRRALIETGKWNMGSLPFGIKFTGWWFGTWILFFHIGNNHPNWRTHILQRGRYTTNQV